MLDNALQEVQITEKTRMIKKKRKLNRKTIKRLTLLIDEFNISERVGEKRGYTVYMRRKLHINL